ncbi:Hsp70 family protein [Pseudonocardia sp. CA-107938]|uniref:Hsp70 family protein n=1 Tax=Pseudonocardia sp. CA-107938 TaxID=3240021 RepID=UPI003D8B2069
MSYRLGIDVGTTYTAAAVSRSAGQGWSEPESVTLGTRGATVPSVLYIADDGTVVVGEAAERRAVTDPDRVVRQFKRRIGDRTPIVAGGRAWAPEDLSARLVRWVVDRVAEREGGPADAIAITHPASWGPHKKDLFAGALGAQGLTVTFLAEPQAAALSYAASERVPNGSTIAVYDLGGGTFDAAVVHKAEGAGPAGFGLVGRPEGLERLGGIDFDQVVFDHVRDGLPEAFAELDDTDPAVLSAVAQIRRECTEAKEALSSDTEVSIPVMLPASRGSVRLHRSEFEGLIYPQVEDTVTALRRAVQSAGLAPEQLTAVLLVGGSSRIPLVGQLVSEQLGRPVAVDADPKNAIAKGAALAIAPRPAASPAQATGGHRRPGGAAAAGAAGAAGLAAGAAAGSALPPPPRPGRASLPQHTPPPTPVGPPQQSWQPPPGGSRHGSAPPPRPVHEPANALFSAGDEPVRPSRRRAEPEPAEQDWDYDDYDGRRRSSGRPSGLLLGVGGVLAVAAVVAGALIWNANRTTPTGSSSAIETGASSPPAGQSTSQQHQATKAPGKATQQQPQPPTAAEKTTTAPPSEKTTTAAPPQQKTTTAAPPANNGGTNGGTGGTGGDTTQGAGRPGTNTGVAAVPTGGPAGASPVSDGNGPVVRTA